MDYNVEYVDDFTKCFELTATNSERPFIIAKRNMLDFLGVFRNRYRYDMQPDISVFSTIKRIQISHIDLDGYGCNIVTRSYANPNVIHPVEQRDKEGAIVHYNTERLGDEVYNLLANVIRTEQVHSVKQCTDSELERIMSVCKTTDPAEVGYANGSRTFYYDHMYILITDLGGLTLEGIKKVVRNTVRPGVKVHILVVDHHRSAYMDAEQTLKNDIELGAHDIIVTDKDENYDAHIYINPDYSATKILNGLYKQAIKEYDGHDEHVSKGTIYNCNIFSDAVSNYDTGKWGNWLINLDDSMRSFNEDIDMSIILNTYWAWARKRHKAGMINAMDKFVESLRNTIVCNMKLSDHIIYQIYTNICDMRRRYQKFCERIQRVGISQSNTTTLFEDDKYTVVMNTKGINIDALYVIVDHPDDPDDVEHQYPYSMFARSFLEQKFQEFANAAYICLARVDLADTNSVNMRSLDNNYNVNLYELAKTNGGGGHKCAAGFPIKN